MKQLLFVAMIHLLILHQYQKDKKEALAPKKEPPAKKIIPDISQDYYWLNGIKIYPDDSLIYSAHRQFSDSYPHHYFSYTSW